MKMCRFIRRELGPFVDGELRGPRRMRVARHLDACPDCASHAEAIAALGDTLRTAAPVESAPLGFEGLANRVIGRTRAESAVSRRSWLERAGGDWHWVTVGCGAVAATIVSTMLASVILAFGPAPEREDSLSALLNNLGSPAGLLFVYASPAGSKQDAVLLQVDNGQPTASRMTAALASMSDASRTEADLVQALASVVIQQGGRVVPLASLPLLERHRAELLLTEIMRLRDSQSLPVGRYVDVHEVRLVIGVNVIGVTAKSL
jgi:hypothetical protein